MSGREKSMTSALHQERSAFSSDQMFQKPCIPSNNSESWLEQVIKLFDAFLFGLELIIFNQEGNGKGSSVVTDTMMKLKFRDTTNVEVIHTES